MLNEEMEYYTEEGTSSVNNGSESQVSGDIEYEEQEEGDFCKYRKEQIFEQIDFMKRKTKIACTIG
jgi:hypothetical protein